MKHLSVIALLFAGIVHLLPVPGVMGANTLTRLYGIDVSDPNTAILMQHRALLFGVLGVLMLSAIALPWLRVTVTCPLQPYQSVGERPKGLQVN